MYVSFRSAMYALAVSLLLISPMRGSYGASALEANTLYSSEGGLEPQISDRPENDDNIWLAPYAVAETSYMPKSVNDGQTWQGATPISTYPDGIASMQIATDGAGKWMAVYQETTFGTPNTSRNVYRTSVDAGQTWSDPIELESYDWTGMHSIPQDVQYSHGVWLITMATFDSDVPGVKVFRIIGDGAAEPVQPLEGEVNVTEVIADDLGTWLLAGFRYDDQGLVVYRSTDDAVAWTSTTIVAEPLANSIQHPVTGAIDGDGRAILVWRENATSRYRMILSLDRGATWSEPADIQGMPDYGFGMDLSLASDKRATWLLGIGNNNTTGPQFAVSRNLGATWELDPAEYPVGEVEAQGSESGTFVLLQKRITGDEKEVRVLRVVATAYITPSVLPENTGTVTGGGAYPYGETVTLNAIPAEGYQFLHWTENGQTISTSPQLTFVATTNRAPVAVFVEIPPPPPDEADLGIMIDTTSVSPLVGQILPFQVTVSNAGPTTASSVIVKALLTSGSVVISTDPPQDAATSRPDMPVWLVGEIAPGATAVFTFNAIATAAGSLSVTADVSAATLDPLLANNVDNVVVTVGEGGQPVPTADLTVSIEATVTSVTLGQTIPVRVQIANQGLSPAAAVTAKLILPAGTIVQSANPPQGVSSQQSIVVWQLGDVAAGGTVAIDVVLLPTVPGTFSFIAEAFAATFDPNLGNNSASSPGFVIEQGPGPDLTGVVSATIKNRRNNVRLRGSVYVTNRGDELAGKSLVNFYLSDDAILDGSDALIASRKVRKIKVNGHRNVRFTAKLPLGIVLQGKFVIAATDAGGVVVESNEFNNNAVLELK